jgi:hypothetical protein
MQEKGAFWLAVGFLPTFAVSPQNLNTTTHNDTQHRYEAKRKHEKKLRKEERRLDAKIGQR